MSNELKNRMSNTTSSISDFTKSFMVWISWFGTVFLALLFAYLYVTASGILSPIDTPTQGDGPAGVSDLLVGMAPLFAAVIAFLFGIFGLRRLENYDSQIKELRESIETNVDKDITRFRERQDSFQEDFMDQISALVDKKFQESRSASIDELEQQADQKFSELDEKYANVFRRLQPYEWLSRKETTFLGIEDETVLESAGRLHDTLSELHQDNEYSVSTSLVRQALSSGKLSGSPDDFFNMAVEMATSDYESLSLKICEHALEKYSTNVDLLSHALKMSTSIGHKDKSKEYINKLEEVGKARWNWRAFQFICDYYKESSDLEAFNSTCEEWAQAIPTDERAYSSRIEQLLSTGQLEEALRLTDECLECVPSPPQTCHKIGSYLVGLGRPKEGLKYLLSGLPGQAITQPTVTPGAYEFGIATAYDSIAITNYRDFEANASDEKSNLHLQMAENATQAKRWYRLSGQISPIPAQKKQAIARTVLMDLLLGEESEVGGIDPRMLDMLMQRMSVSAEGVKDD